MADLVNYRGEKIVFKPKLRKPEYGSGKCDRFGNEKPEWSLIKNGDGQGFDKDHKEPNDLPRMKIALPKHTKLIRYGSENGSFTAPKGTKFEELSLPYTKESLFYHEYEVIADSISVIEIDRACVVDRGKVAPGFDYPGGGVQYLHEYNMINSINMHLLREI